MKHLIAFLLFVACLSRTLADPRYYDNYTVYRVHIKNSHQQIIIDQLLEQHDNTYRKSNRISKDMIEL
ncbi:uncharacterized protein Dana_GF27094 [Drosophila ananassae]|uniref:Uncharacterized protein n=1 Tax=Drosophila ananassae TaxID=7217 RepID=A0A0P8XF08_DROAN|nr:uncharacterized protein Dana_GF27094 [Drosophila ananassae]